MADKKNWDFFSFQELCTGPHNMRLCIIMQPHEVMVADEWYNKGTPQFCSKHGHEQSAH